MNTIREVTQLVNFNGKPHGNALSADKWFIHNDPKGNDGIQVKNYAYAALNNGHLKWSDLFAQQQAGNKVNFFTTGADYFKDILASIEAATESVFITGWQVNYDVELADGKTLLHALRTAMGNGAKIYVMPWLSPKAGVDTGDLETCLAIAHLNVGAKKGKAYALPAIQQGDQGSLGIFFAHHQKAVVIDNKKAYVGGIDLAYGRRDDSQCSLKANGRTLNEMYSPGMPKIKTLTNVEKQDTVTKLELLAALMTNGPLEDFLTFLTSPSEGYLAEGLDLTNGVVDAAEKLQHKATDWVENAGDFFDDINLISKFNAVVKELVIDATQDLIVDAIEGADPALKEDVKQQFTMLAKTGGAYANNASSVVMSWLNGSDISNISSKALSSESTRIINAIVLNIAALSHQDGFKRDEPYERLFEKVKASPLGGNSVDPNSQPRMPWHDVHCAIEGPAVYDMSVNFIGRWDGAAHNLEQSFSLLNNGIAKKILNGLNYVLTPKAPLVRIQKSLHPKRSTDKKGSNTVQVLRSAPRNLLKDERTALKNGKPVPEHAQNNCLKAMIKGIQSAQHFIYIENQFYQSAHGEVAGYNKDVLSGPLGSLLEIQSIPAYKPLLKELEIDGVPVEQIPLKIRWSKLESVAKKAMGDEFISDLKTVLINIASIKALDELKEPQKNLLNPINQALLNRITRAIEDDQQFHIYMVLPVHPEGALNVLNIITQVHLTMQSLVFGRRSLVNGIRAAILKQRYVKEGKKPDAAQRMVNELLATEKGVKDLGELVEDDWKQYLTLLNLRNWDTINGKPVTEQIYIHSKLMIVDDCMALLGSANINDRSQLGDRDSEIAVMVTDGDEINIPIDGKASFPVAKSVHQFRKNLWKKIFGLNSKRPAASLAAVLDQPAAPSSWKAIQEVAYNNTRAYEDAFYYIPRSSAHPNVQAKVADDKSKRPPPASIWPTWQYINYLDHTIKGGKLKYRMPFDPLFWRETNYDDATGSWNVGVDVTHRKALAPTSAPDVIGGFITELPVYWTEHENNQSGMNLTALANNNQKHYANRAIVADANTDETNAST